MAGADPGALPPGGPDASDVASTEVGARTAVAMVFVVNGACFATWVSRIPEARASFGLTNTSLGVLLLVAAVGSLLALPTTGAAIARWGTVRVVRAGTAVATTGLASAGAGLDLGPAVTVAGLFLYGVGMGVWDVAMNVEGAEVERALGRTVMPRFHAGFSLGTVAGALVGAALVAWDVSATLHVVGVAALAAAAVWRAGGRFLPVAGHPEDVAPPARAAWREPRTLLIGLVVLALALTEGTANDWLAVALVDGHGVSHATGVAGFGAFVAAMTATRFVGAGLLDRFGRVTVLWATTGLAGVGVLLIVWGSGPVVVVGILAWGAGAALGFPVGMSAAADDPRRAPARVSVVSTIGYAAFLAGPPLLGVVGDRVGTLAALLVVGCVLVPAAAAAPALRPPALRPPTMGVSPARRPGPTGRRRGRGSRAGRG